MNNLLIALLIVGVIVVAGIVSVSAFGVKTTDTTNVGCKSCGNSCTADNNCGLATCGATQGKTCNCGR